MRPKDGSQMTDPQTNKTTYRHNFETQRPTLQMDEGRIKLLKNGDPETYDEIKDFMDGNSFERGRYQAQVALGGTKRFMKGKGWGKLLEFEY
jgi:hypothetical protein